MTSLEYVGSGTSHLRIYNLNLFQRPDVIETINGLFRSVDGLHNHNFSLLYNAFVEKSYGDSINKYYRKALHKVHSDSGGLQIITRGLDITKDLRKSVYKAQADFSDIGMCFDEIPVATLGESSDRNDVKMRWFDKANLDEYARKTGENIKDQIEFFLEYGAETKPILIAQGNDYETYCRWTEVVLKQIPPHQRKYIGGIAIAGAALGTGPLEDIQRAAYAVHLPLEVDYIHILGVGSIRRLLPYLTFAQNGYYDPGLHLSYDSTTHTSGLSLGLYFKDGTLTRFYRHIDDFYHEMYENIDGFYDLKGHGIDIEKFYKIVNGNAGYFKDGKTIRDDDLTDYYYGKLTFSLSSIRNFMDTVNQCLQSKLSLLRTADSVGVGRDIASLSGVKTLDDFHHWFKNFGSYVRSNKVTSQSITTLDSFWSE